MNPEINVVHPGQKERAPVGMVGRLIRMKRAADKVSLRQAGKAAGIDWNTIGRLERCEIVPNLRNFLKLADWLELSPEGAMAVARTLVREVDHRAMLQQEITAFPRLTDADRVAMATEAMVHPDESGPA